MSASTKGSVARPAATLNTQPSPTDFRARLYQNYANLTETAGGAGSGNALRRAVRVFPYHLRGWLPADRVAPVRDAASSVRPS